MSKVVFIANGGSAIGMGHLVRTTSLAEQFRNENFQVIFISKYQKGIDFLIRNKFSTTPISSNNLKQSPVPGFDYGNENELQEDMKKIGPILEQEVPDVLVLDSYNVTEEYFLFLKKHTKCLVYIDDLNLFKYPVDILINGTICAKNYEYRKSYKKEIMLLGLKYNLIRSEFKNLPKRKVNRDAYNIIITVGGSDPYHMTEKLINYVSMESEFNNRVFHVIIASGFTNKEEIKNLSDKYRNIVTYENPCRMSEIMLKSDLAIVAGGSTLYELVACKVPIIAFCYAENQKMQVEVMEKQALIKNIGDYKELEYEFFYNVYKEMVENTDERKKMVKMSKDLIDGKGTERIVSKIKKLLKYY